MDNTREDDRVVETVRGYYDASVESEWRRLEKHPYEFAINTHYMARYIKPGDRVLDVGGGPGRYSLWLAEYGCDVTLLDLSAANVAFALGKAAERRLPLRGIAGDARVADTMFPGETFDHVLLMGPLYHLFARGERMRCAEACRALLAPGGVLFAAFISSYAGMLYCLREEPAMILNRDEDAYVDSFLRDEPFAGRGFTEAYMERHGDIAPFFAEAGFEKLHLVGSESILAPFHGQVTAQTPQVYNKLLEVALAVCEREDLLPWSEHYLYVGRRL